MCLRIHLLGNSLNIRLSAQIKKSWGNQILTMTRACKNCQMMILEIFKQLGEKNLRRQCIGVSQCTGLPHCRVMYTESTEHFMPFSSYKLTKKVCNLKFMSAVLQFHSFGKNSKGPWKCFYRHTSLSLCPFLCVFLWVVQS